VMWGWIYLSLAILFGTIGQLSLKYALLRPSASRGFASLLLSGPMAIWLACYVGTMLSWLLALRSIPLSQAFPILGLQYALIPVLSSRFLAERLIPSQWGGILLIVAGVFLVGHS
jgi:undecaprenyl phosphate-alpha-L-ara4N flippase subunit ArnE